MLDKTEQKLYSVICRHDGIKAREIADILNIDRKTVNHYLYSSPLMHELCYTDRDYCWHGLIRQSVPHYGLEEFSGYYSSLSEFLALSPDEWFSVLCEGCERIGRNLNDTRGLFHSFIDCHEVVYNALSQLCRRRIADSSWEVVFELRIKRSRHIRIYADVLLISKAKIFSLEFKMKDIINQEEILQSAKYVPFLETIFGPTYDIIPALILTKASELYLYEQLGSSDAAIPVCSGDMLPIFIEEYV